jgi:hypothetical protein
MEARPRRVNNKYQNGADGSKASGGELSCQLCVGHGLEYHFRMCIKPAAERLSQAVEHER